ncbi:MAG: hypothetical protein ABIJ11_02040 [Elusimicrobiota bacterium]
MRLVLAPKAIEVEGVEVEEVGGEEVERVEVAGVDGGPGKWPSNITDS